MNTPRLMQGNEAVVEGALAAGVRFYAGYPITPSTEVAELMAEQLPKLGGKFIQMEDEIGSMAAVIGASLTGSKAMTATSGPGFSLKQENIGYAVMAEVPCLVVDVQRLGPSTGIATAPAQGDVMQARWGTHGDHPIIALAPSSVEECYHVTVKAVNLAEKYRIPVILLLDEVVGHMREKVVLPDGTESIERPKPLKPPELFDFADARDQDIRPLPAFGDGYHIHITGLAHDHQGFAVSDPEVVEKELRRLHRKVESNLSDIIYLKSNYCEDAELVVLAYGCVARSAASAVKLARLEGLKVGLLCPVTIWPFPEQQVGKLAAEGKNFLVAEMNCGQLTGEVRRVADGRAKVDGLNKINGQLIRPDEILAKIREVMPGAARG